MDDENLTFKPQLHNKTPATRNKQSSVPTSNVGMQKYMERVQKANKMKQEKKDLEAKVFGTGKNWTPQVTQPAPPKLTVKKNNYMSGMMYDNQLTEDALNNSLTRQPNHGGSSNGQINGS